MKTFLSFGLVIALIILVNVVTFPRNSDAAKLALRKGGFSSVSHVERSWFNLCHDEFAGYNVTGIRNGSKQTVLVCAYPKPLTNLYSYIR